ncbi:hypothetical protein QQF64_025877, partial [Cirrhinus molitorella]
MLHLMKLHLLLSFKNKTCVQYSHLIESLSKFLLQLFIKAAEIETQTGEQMLKYLSQRKSSVLLEVLKLQTEKKPVQLGGWSEEENEMRVSFSVCPTSPAESLMIMIRLIRVILLDLCSHVKNYETQTGRSFLPALQSVFQSPDEWIIDLSQRKSSVLLEVLKLQTEKKTVELRGLSEEESEVKSFLQCLPYISQLRIWNIYNQETMSAVRFLLNLCVAAVEMDKYTGTRFSTLLSSVCSYKTFPFHYNHHVQSGFLLDLCSHVKNYETQTDRSFLPALQSVFQSPDEWIIDLSQRKSSVLLEVLKLQTEKKTVELRGLSEEESEVKSFLQCLPYISQLRIWNIYNQETMSAVRFLLNLCVAAVEMDKYTGTRFSTLLSSVCSYKTFPFSEMMREYDGHDQSGFLLDLYSHVKNYETQTDRSFLPVLQSVFQSPDEWIIDLSQRKSSVLLEVLKLQTEKKTVELRGCSEEESEMKSFLQCLPYISQLRFSYLIENVQSKLLLQLFIKTAEIETQTGAQMLKLSLREKELCPPGSAETTNREEPVELRGLSEEESEIKSFLQCLPYISQLRFSNLIENVQSKFLLQLFIKAAEIETQTGEQMLKLLASVCTSSSDYRLTEIFYDCDFLLDLCSRVRNYETQTGRSFLPALQSVFQSLDEWIIDLSQRKSSVLLEVLKLQTEKRPVELIGLSEEESEMKSFLQCLPYISQLRFSNLIENVQSKFLLQLFIKAAEIETQTGEQMLKLLASVCTSSSDYRLTEMFKDIDFLLDLCSHVKNYETQTGRSFLPVLQSVFQSPDEWIIDLSQRKSSVLLEVLKLQTEKKPVELIGLSEEESKIKSFLQCLPYISQLRFSHLIESLSKFLLQLFIKAAEIETQTGEQMLKLLASVCTSSSDYRLTEIFYDCDFPLDLCSHVKNYETQTGRSFLPALQSVFQSLDEWIIDLSQRKSSVLLEVLKLQTEKKPVQLGGWSEEENEMKSFLQCLPYISQLRFWGIEEGRMSAVRFLLNLCVAAVEMDKYTGTRFSTLLSSVCSYKTFPFHEELDDYDPVDQSDFLLDLCSHVKNYETQTGRSFLPALQSVFQSPDEWIIDLSQRKSSVLLEVLKLQTEKKTVELRGLSEEESEVKSFLQCLPYISQLSDYYKNLKKREL